ncbi:MAG: hypothetical protein CMB37_04525 [Euryarchaeota archaeon]|nr:hypothetical protein [Euryarchaeota archaeon]
MRSRGVQDSARWAIFLIFLLTLSLIPVSSATQGRAGPDVFPSAAYVSYSNSADHADYAALSSQDPASIGMNRPADLWIVDGMLGLSQDIEITVENQGDAMASNFNVDIEILHNEYADFVLYTYRGSITQISPGSSATLTTSWIPHYSGNHTIQVTTLLNGDTNPANDIGTRSLTIGNLYDRAEASGTWTLGSNWYVSSEASLSGSNSFHVGGSTSSTNYGNNWDTSLTSAIIDTSDAHTNPSSGYGIGFFYTGEALTGDGYDIDIWTGNAWQRITTTVASTVDTDFIDGSSWLINVNQVNGDVVPWWNIPANLMNSQFKFRINFHSDASATSLGYWFEDIVMFYDQKARASEYGLSVNAGNSGHSRGGEWAETTITVMNSGNLSDTVSLGISNLQSGWEYKFQHMSGSQIQGATIDLQKGETKTVKLLVKPPIDAALGGNSLTVITQSSESSVSDSTVANFIVDPSYQPNWVGNNPGFGCAPGNACDFEITLRNDGDGQDTFSLTSEQILTQTGWTFGLKWDQPTMITLPKDGTEIVTLTANLASDALPGMRANTAFTATSQADPSKISTLRANVTASMVSIASVGVSTDDIPEEGWWISPGETITVPFTIWNNATQQDQFTFTYESTGVFGWNIEVISSESVVIGPDGLARVLVSFTAPESAQANDPGPIFTPQATSIESGMSASETVFSQIRVRQLHDIEIIMNAPEIDISPGMMQKIPFEIENHGNGAENVVFDLVVNANWNWWVEVNSATLTGPLSLTTVHDGGSSMLANLWIEIPGTEEPAQLFDLEFTARPYEGVDSTIDDSTFTWQYRTQMTAIPDISEFDEEETSLWLGQMHSWTLLIQNLGNTYDGSTRMRITADKNIPGMVVTAETSRGISQLNGWVDLPMSPTASENVLVTFETLDSFPLGESVRLTLEVEGGRIGVDDALQTVSTSITVNVDQKRSINVVWNLDSSIEFEPELLSTFHINVTTDSTMDITLDLNTTIPDSVFLDCRPHSQDGAIILFLPASSPGPAQTHSIECSISLEADDRDRTVSFIMSDESGNNIWESGPVHLKTQKLEAEGGFSGFGDAAFLIGGVLALMIFAAFFAFMTTMILRRRRQLDDLEEMEEYEEEDNQQTHQPTVQYPATQNSHESPPGPMPQSAVNIPATTEQVQAPKQLAAEDYTDEQLRASGWSVEQISELRGLNQSPSVQEGVSAVQSTLPAFTCVVSGRVLTTSDSWWQCHSCGAFADANAISAHTNCPSCGQQK